MRIGLFGGSFDPVHLGHLLVAQAAREEQNLDRIFFIPAAQSPFKLERKLISGAERLRLLRLALAGNSFCEVDDQELSRGGISYSIETVRNYREKFPEAKFFSLIGGDNVSQLPKWRDAKDLATQTEFLVIPRPGEIPLPLPAPFKGKSLLGYPLGVSSSQIRTRIQAGLSIENLVPRAVAEAIRKNQLYL